MLGIAKLYLGDRGDTEFASTSRAPRHEPPVAATWQRGRLIWDGARVLSKPGDGRFVARGV